MPSSVTLCNLPTLIVLFSACALIVLAVIAACIEGFRPEAPPPAAAPAVDTSAVASGMGGIWGYVFGPVLSFLGHRRWGGYLLSGCLLLALPQYAKLPGSDSVCPAAPIAGSR